MRKRNYIDANFAKEISKYENPEIAEMLNKFLDEQPSCNELLYWFVAWIGLVGFTLGFIFGGAL